jgi:hypothetical protein
MTPKMAEYRAQFDYVMFMPAGREALPAHPAALTLC